MNSLESSPIVDLGFSTAHIVLALMNYIFLIPLTIISPFECALDSFVGNNLIAASS